LGVELGYRWNDHWQTHIGYDLIYWTHVARAGDQIDLNLGQSGNAQNPSSWIARRTSWPKA